MLRLVSFLALGAVFGAVCHTATCMSACTAGIPSCGAFLQGSELGTCSHTCCFTGSTGAKGGARPSVRTMPYYMYASHMHKPDVRPTRRTTITLNYRYFVNKDAAPSETHPPGPRRRRTSASSPRPTRRSTGTP